MKNWLFTLAVAIASSAVAADEQIPLGNKDCQVMHGGGTSGVTIDWNGTCKDGLAEGEGKLVWRLSGKLIATYEGGLRRGLFHGVGYFARLDDNSQYEGNYVDGKREGFGIAVDALGDRYDGNWKAGEKHGRGKMVYVLGGSYDGEWQDDVFHGKGTIVYAGGRRADYQFVNGRWPGAVVQDGEVKLPHLNMKSNDTILGSRLKRALVRGGTVPYDLPYKKLTAVQKQLVASKYPLMDQADEPPYPINGPASIFRALADHAERHGAEGGLEMLVKIGVDGKALSVTAIGTPGDNIKKIATHLVLLDTYKPGMCAGKPCEMIYPFSVQFTREW